MAPDAGDGEQLGRRPEYTWQTRIRIQRVARAGRAQSFQLRQRRATRSWRERAVWHRRPRTGLRRFSLCFVRTFFFAAKIKCAAPRFTFDYGNLINSRELRGAQGVA